MASFSARGADNLANIMTKIPKSLLEPTSSPGQINLSFAENWVVREEVLATVKAAIDEQLNAHVRRLIRPAWCPGLPARANIWV
jgi:hypothetical protein